MKRKPPKPLTPRAETEVQITALLMGELSPEEAAALEAQIAADPEFTALHARLRRAAELVREASALPEEPAALGPARLSSERREALLAHFKTVAAPRKVSRPRWDWSWMVPVGLAAALVALLGGVLFTNELAQRKAIFGIARSTAVPGGTDETASFAERAANLVMGQIRAAPDVRTQPSGNGPIGSNGVSLYPYSQRQAVPAQAIVSATPSPRSEMARLNAVGANRTKDKVLRRGDGAADSAKASEYPAHYASAGTMTPSRPPGSTFTELNSPKLLADGSNTYSGGTNTISDGTVKLNVGKTTIALPAEAETSADTLARPAPGSAGGGAAAPAAANQAVGHIAFWNDEDTAKINIPTAGSGGGTISGNTRTPVAARSAGSFAAGGAGGSSGSNVFNGGGTSASAPQQAPATDAPGKRITPQIKSVGDFVSEAENGKTVAAVTTKELAETASNMVMGQIRETAKSRNEARKSGTSAYGLYENQAGIPQDFDPALRPPPAKSEKTAVKSGTAIELPASPGEPELRKAGKELTAGNRSGNLTASGNAIDALLFPTTGAPTSSASAPTEKTMQYFNEASGFFEAGRYSLAKKRAEQILSVDPYNTAARTMVEKVDRAMSDYGVAAYNEARADAIKNTDLAWARPVRRFNTTPAPADPADLADATENMRRKLDRIVIPKLELKNATIRQAIDYLKKKSVELDDVSPPGQRGTNMVLKLSEAADAGLPSGRATAAAPAPIPGIPGLLPEPADAAKTAGAAGAAAPAAGRKNIFTAGGTSGTAPPANQADFPFKKPGVGPDVTNPAPADPADARITLNLTNIPLVEALKYVTGLANVKFKVEPHAISVVPVTENTDILVTKEWKIPPDLIPRKAGDADTTMETASGIADRESAMKWLMANGVSFAGSSTALYIPKSSRLIVRNTQEQLDLADKIIEVGIEAKAAEQAAKQAGIPQPEVQTSVNAFSTFSLNVSDVSFKLAAAGLEQGKMPEPGTVRSEEFVNAFDYRDPEPAPGAPLACVTERARYPFAQNRDLLRCSVKTAAAGRQPGRPLNIVLLLDKSGSMERADRVAIVREALRVLSGQLQAQDKLSIVTFARTPRLWADGVAGDKAGEVTARVSEITPEGGTDLAAALDLGYETALHHFQTGSINRVVMLTDGAANLGDVNPETLKKKVEAHRQQGIALDCFGIGWEGLNDDLLEQLTRHGDGRYGFLNTPEEAATGFAGQLAGALHVAAADVKVQIEFNPRRVTAYRQIGYAQHQLKKEQFRDNTVDAAEIGAAESGTALYVVEVDPRGEGDLATVRVRFKVPDTSDYEEHEWAVPFTAIAEPLEQASPALRLAATAGAFAEWLVASPYATEVTSDRLIGLINGVPGIYGADPRPQKLEWMLRQAKSLSGR